MSIDWGTAPNWITPCIAGGALVVAYKSIQSQREIARKRAATDFFIKTEMDRDARESHKKFTDAVDGLKKIITDTGEMQNSFANTDEYWAIREYLNLHELMAVGLLKGVFDDDVCFDFWSGELVLAYENTLPLITYVQMQKHSENIYAELTKVAKEWRNRKTVY